MTTQQTQPRAAVAVTTPGAYEVTRAGQWTNREAELIANVLGRDLTPTHLRAYAAICRHTGLDPFKRQIYAWLDKGRLTIHIAIGGWRGMAARSGTYNGQTSPEWCGPDGVWRGIWLADEPPAAARVGVYRTGQPEPVYGVVTYREFQRTQARVGAKNPTVWDEKPAHMLATRAEYQALQKACPEAFEESQQAIQQFNVAIEAVSEEEIPEPGHIIDRETGGITEAATAELAVPAYLYDWQEELEAALEPSPIDGSHIRTYLGLDERDGYDDTLRAIDEWLRADDRRTVRGLVSTAADAIGAGQTQRGRQ